MSDTSFGLRAPVPLSKMDGRPHFPESNYVREREQWSACLRMMREMCWGDILGHTALTCVLFSQCLTGLLKHPQAQCTQAREERRHHWAFNYRETEYCHHHSAFNFTDDSYYCNLKVNNNSTRPEHNGAVFTGMTAGSLLLACYYVSFSPVSSCLLEER